MMKTIISTTPTQLVFTRNEKLFTSSLIIAQQFGKEHSHVLRDIRDLDCSDKFKESNFGCSFYINTLHNGGQRKYPMYEMTKDGFMFLVMGFTGKKAGLIKETFIEAFNAMANTIADLRLNERVLTKYISFKLDQSIEDINKYRRQLAKEYEGSRPSSSGIKPMKWSKSLDFKTNFDNLLSSYHRAVAEGNYYYANYKKEANSHQHLKFKIGSLGYKIARLEF